jgi:hypothetical protein
MPLVLPVPAADIAAIKPDHDAFGRRCRRLCRFRGVRLHNCLAGPLGSVAHCARVMCPANRKQFRQQVCGRQRRISRRHIDRSVRAPRSRPRGRRRRSYLLRPRSGRDREQAPNPSWHVTEQRAECRGIISLTGQLARTSHACTAMLAGDRNLCRDDLPWIAAKSCFAASRSPRSARPACSSRSRRATSASVVCPVSNSASNLTRQISFATSSPSSREPVTYRNRKPSRPGESHPEPLTEPDLNLSTHPARATH